MNTRSVILWLVAALLLGLLTLWLVSRGGSGTGAGAGAGRGGVVPIGQPVLPFSMSDASTITVQQADGWTDRLERSSGVAGGGEGAGGWMLRVGRPGSPIDPELVGWPVTPARLSALVRVLNEARATALAPTDASLGDKPTHVTVDLATLPANWTTPSATISLAERTLGGAGLIEIRTGAGNSLRAIVDATLLDVFRSPGPRAWRDVAVFQAGAAQSSRVSLQNPTQKLALGKLDGRWSLREPVSAPADPAAVSRLLNLLDDVRVTDFLDTGGGGAPTGLETPSARLSIETDVRSPTDASVSVQRTDLTLGAPGDSQGTKVFASLNASWLLLIDGRALSSLSMDPVLYLWPAPTTIAGPEIGEVQLTRVGGSGISLKRTLQRWSQFKPDNTEMLLAENDLKAVDTLVAFLTGADRPTTIPASPTNSTPTPTIALAQPEKAVPVGVITLKSLSGTPLESIDILKVAGATPQTPPSAVLKTGDVWRTYPLDRLPKLLADLLAPPPGSSGPSTEKKPTEINK